MLLLSGSKNLASAICMHAFATLPGCHEQLRPKHGEYIKKYMPVDDLYQHIWKSKGGDSLDFFKNILYSRPHATDFVHLMDNYNDSLSSLLGKI